jgi:SAM-dependent methyltransferase
MDPTIAGQLMRLPSLDRANAWASALACKVCGKPSPFFDVTDFNKCVGAYRFGPAGIGVPWHRCDACGFLFTGFFDDWSPDDFRRWIYNDDYIKIDGEYLEIRPRRVAERWAAMLKGHEALRILDYGGGTGVFAERMRQLGFANTEAYDPFSLPVRPSGAFDIITCIEVIEHVPQPSEMLADMRSFLHAEGCIVIGESLQPPTIDQMKCNWWYVAPRNGHVSMYADRTLAILADRTGMVFHRGNEGPHVMRLGERFRSFADGLGTALSAFRLGAPGQPGAPGFSSVEGAPPEDRFQWTRETEISWHISVPGVGPRAVQILLPFTAEARPRFAAECTLRIAGRVVRPDVRGRSLFKEIPNVSAGEVEVSLSTPDLKSANGRDIGLALLVT